MVDPGVARGSWLKHYCQVMGFLLHSGDMSDTQPTKDVQALYEVGAHFGYGKARRHPSAVRYLFGTKHRSDVFNLESTAEHLEKALAFVIDLAKQGKQILFVGGKPEVSHIVKNNAELANLPYVSGRWIGGTLTNSRQIRGRVEKMKELIKDRETGARDKYTKKERVLFDRDIDNLEFRFGGLESMEGMPAALFVVDTRYEHIAVAEANQRGIPVIGLASSDCDFSKIQYPIPANDANIKSVSFVVDAIAKAYRENLRPAVRPQGTREEAR